MSKDKINVLIVDDFEMVRMMLKNALNGIGIKNISEATNGKQAKDMVLEKINSGAKFDIIFSDWNMPEMDGLELLKFCKGHEAIKKTPFIMVTAESESSFIMEAVRAGADDYLVKPFSPMLIDKKLTRFFGNEAKAV